MAKQIKAKRDCNPQILIPININNKTRTSLVKFEILVINFNNIINDIKERILAKPVTRIIGSFIKFSDHVCEL